MNRLFLEHVKREEFSLDGTWEFIKDEKHVGEHEKWYEQFPAEGGNKVAVPSCVNNRLGMIEYQNVCWYKKEFYTKEGRIRIRFGAVSEYAKVYMDGEYLGDHYGGFSAFEFLKKVEEGIHTLVVMVDARSTQDTIPLYNVDWHHYCGIMRSVKISYLSEIYVDDLKICYELSENLTNARVQITVVLKNTSTAEKNTKVKIWLENELISECDYKVMDEKVLLVEYELQNVRLWDIRKGELYTVRIETEEDDLIDRVGFRRIEVDGKHLLLNGKKLKVKGVNRHEEHPDWGFAVPLSIMQRDMDILKDLNVNMVRGSHYPNSKYFLDLCDEEGILFWSEIPMWGFHEEDLERPLVIERGLKMHEEMVCQYFNHPSIVFWGLHNEIATDTQAGYRITKLFAKKVRSMDQSRLITFATNRMIFEENRQIKDICLEFADIISVNKYVGWYSGEICDWTDFMKQMKNYLKEIGQDRKPILMSEFGVGAMYGHRNFEELRWSENYQMEFYDHTINLFLEDEDMCGVLLWQFCDMRSNAKWQLNRVRSFNNKGILNEYRQPKMAYYKVKELFGGFE